MKKTLLAMTIGSMVFAPAILSASEHNFFGEAKYEAGIIDDGTDRNAQNSFRGTRFGVHGSADLGNGMTGIYRVMGNVGANGSTFAFNEELWAGIAGDFGAVRFGRSDRAHKLAVLPFRAFTDTIADSSGFNTQRWGRDVGIHYRTNSMNGLTIHANYAPNGEEMNADMGLSAVYKTGGFHIALAAESIGEEGANDSTTNMAAGVHYKTGDLGVGVLYQNIGVKVGDDTVQITVPVSYKMGSVVLNAALVNLDKGGADSTDLAVGVQYFFDKKTHVFANVWSTEDADKKHLGLGMSRKF